MAIEPAAAARAVLAVDEPGLVHVGFACNSRCRFCAQGDLRLQDLPLRADQLHDELERLMRVGHRAVALLGGEPTLSADLPGWIRRARDFGFESVLLQTNGRRLAYPAYARELCRAGLSAVEISMAGPREDIHDYHTRVPGSFRQSVAGLSAARRVGLSVGLSFVITRSSFRHLEECVASASAWGAAAVHLACVRARGAARAGLSQLVPRFEAMAPYLRRAVRAADCLGIPVLVSGVPWCWLPDPPGRSLEALRAASPNDAEHLAEVCDACRWRTRCPGLDLVYRERYGDAELAARREAAVPLEAVAATDSQEWLAFFAGLGVTETADASRVDAT